MLTKKEFIVRANKIHKNIYDYTFAKYVNTNTKVKIVCPLHDTIFYQIPKSHLKGYSGCSKCAQLKKIQTNLEKYGVEYPQQSKIFKEKTIQTNLEKHGVEHVLQSKKIKEKIKQTNLEKYGVEYPQQSEKIREKQTQKNLEKYGVEYIFQLEEFKEKTKQTNLEKYGVEHHLQLDKFRDKQKQTNLEKYGVENPFQSEEIKEKIKQTNLEKYGVENPKQSHFKADTLNKLTNVKWLYKQHITNERTLCNIAYELGVNESTVGIYLHDLGIETQNYFSSVGEREVLAFIESLGISTISNTRNIIPPYELDIYIPEHNLAVEYCGLYWHSEQAGKDKHYHKRKYDMCKEQGIQLITIFEDEWFDRKKQVKRKLKSMLYKDDSMTIYARKTSIVKVSTHSKKTFYNENHIQGNGGGSINIGLIYDNKLAACMSFIKSGNNYELNRYATSAKVIGGFSKLLKHFITEYQPKEIISFADLRWSTGNLYTKTGWKIDKILLPDYSYSPDAVHRFHKFNYRRKNLPKLLENFNPDLSEKINCDNNGILRIWDCGKIRFKYPLDY